MHLHLIYDHIGGTSANLLQLRNFVIVLLSFAGFFRFSEVANLRRSDVKFSLTHMTIFIEKSKTDIYRDDNYYFIAKHIQPFAPLKHCSDLLLWQEFAMNLKSTCFAQYLFLRPKIVTYLGKTITHILHKLLGEIGLNPKQSGYIVSAPGALQQQRIMVLKTDCSKDMDVGSVNVQRMVM